jgi:tripeptide aminopeptidase
MFRGYRLPPRSRAVDLGRAALERCGYEPREVATGGGSDANALIARGYECVLLANGTTDNHTPSESVPARDLSNMLGVCEAIVAGAGAA